MKEKGKEIYKTSPPNKLKYLIVIAIVMGVIMLIGTGIEKILENDIYAGYLFLGGSIVTLILGLFLYWIFTKRGEPYIVYENCIYFPPMYRPSKGDKFVYLSDITKIEKGKYDPKNYYVYTEKGDKYKILGWHTQEIMNYIGSKLSSERNLND